jgi:hypothetical protein
MKIIDRCGHQVLGEILVSIPIIRVVRGEILEVQHFNCTANDSKNFLFEQQSLVIRVHSPATPKRAKAGVH